MTCLRLRLLLLCLRKKSSAARADPLPIPASSCKAFFAAGSVSARSRRPKAASAHVPDSTCFFKFAIRWSISVVGGFSCRLCAASCLLLFSFSAPERTEVAFYAAAGAAAYAAFRVAAEFAATLAVRLILMLLMPTCGCC